MEPLVPGHLRSRSWADEHVCACGHTVMCAPHLTVCVPNIENRKFTSNLRFWSDTTGLLPFFSLLTSVIPFSDGESRGSHYPQWDSPSLVQVFFYWDTLKIAYQKTSEIIFVVVCLLTI